MSSDIERVIQRDLDQLPLLPTERWVPTRRVASRGLLPAALRTSTALAVIVLAVAVGVALPRARTGVAERAAVPTSPAATPAEATAAAPSGRIGRREALARIQGLSLLLPTITRIEAKLVSRGVLQAADPSLSARTVASETAWVVAVSGDVRCSFCIAPPAQPFHSALYLLDARTGDVFTTSASADLWPAGFDALPDESLAADSQIALGHVVEIREPDVLTVLTDFPAGPGTRLTLRADADTTFSWGAGLAGGTASSLGELVRNRQLAPGGSAVVRITFDPQRRPDGTYRLESLLTGALSR